jgi:uncharacterized protein
MPGYRRTADLPQVIPVFPLDGALLLPGGELPLQVFEPRYLNMVDDVMAGDRIIGMIQTRPGGERARPSLVDVGCAGRITSYAETSDGRYLITLTGVCRFQAGEELAIRTPYRQVKANYDPFEGDLGAEDEVQTAAPAARDKFARALKRYLNHRELDIDWETASTAPEQLGHGPAVRPGGKTGPSGSARPHRPVRGVDHSLGNRCAGGRR